MCFAFGVGEAGGVDAAEEKCHIVGKGAHGLHAFFVEFGFAFVATVNNVPILRGNYSAVGLSVIHWCANN